MRTCTMCRSIPQASTSLCAAVLSGRGDELIDLAKGNLFREDGATITHSSRFARNPRRLTMPMSTLLHNQLRACRSFLLTPGSRPEGFPAAHAAGGDAIIVDLESPVAPADKGRAREAARAFLRRPPVPDFVRLVRLNSPHLVDGL